MKTMKKIITLSLAALFISALGMNASFAGKPTGGGGKSVEVTAAAPNDANQGQELDVIISGSGFDNGSEVSFFVTGSADASQVEVLSVEYIRKTKQLKTHIKVKDTAVSSEYDIEVRASSGRKGKGTTLFKVKQQESEPLDPAMAVGITRQSSSWGQKYGNLFVFEEDGVRNQIIVERASGKLYNTLPLTWSPDGSKIIWVDGEPGTINMSNPDGSDEQVILPFDGVIVPHFGGIRNIASTGIDCSGNPANHLYFQARISTDEDWVADFYFLDLNALPSTPVRLTESGGKNFQSIMMSPAGTEIATWTHELADGDHRNPNARLEIRDLCGVGLPVIFSLTASDLGLPLGSQIHETSWSVDGLLAVAVDFPPNYDHDIYLIDMNVAPSSMHAVKIIGAGTGIGDGLENTRARWTPDGKTLVFVSDFHSMYSLDIETGIVELLHNSGTVIRDIEWRPNWVK